MLKREYSLSILKNGLIAVLSVYLIAINSAFCDDQNKDAYSPKELLDIIHKRDLKKTVKLDFIFSSANYSTDGKTIILTSNNDKFYFLNASDGSLIKKLNLWEITRNLNLSFSSSAISPDLSKIFIKDVDINGKYKQFTLIDVNTNEPKVISSGKDISDTAYSFSRDSSKLLLISKLNGGKHILQLFDVKKAVLLKESIVPEFKDLDSITWSPDSGMVAFVGNISVNLPNDMHTKVFLLDTGSLTIKRAIDDISEFSFSDDSKSLVGLGWDLKQGKAWKKTVHLDSNKVEASKPLPLNVKKDVEISIDRNLLFLNTKSKDQEIWDFNQLKPIKKFSSDFAAQLQTNPSKPEVLMNYSGYKSSFDVLSTKDQASLEQEAKRQLQGLLPKTALSQDEKLAVSHAVPFFLDKSSSFYGLPEPANTDLKVIFANLKKAGESPEKIRVEDLFVNPMTAKYISSMIEASGKNLKITPEQAKNLLKALADDPYAEIADLSAFSFLFKTSRFSPQEAYDLFKSSAWPLKSHIEQLLGLGRNPKVGALKSPPLHLKVDSLNTKQAVDVFLSKVPGKINVPNATGSSRASPDGKYILFETDPNLDEWGIFEVSSGKILRKLKTPAPISNWVFSGDEALGSSSSIDQAHLFLLDLKSGEVQREISFLNPTIKKDNQGMVTLYYPTLLSYSKGKSFASINYYKNDNHDMLEIHDLKNQKAFSYELNFAVNKVVFSEDESKAAFLQGQEIFIADLKTGAITKKIDFKSNENSIAFSKDGKRVLTFDGTSYRVFDAESGGLILKKEYPYWSQNGSIFSDGFLLVKGHHDQNDKTEKLRVIDTDDGRIVEEEKYEDASQSNDGEVLLGANFSEGKAVSSLLNSGLIRITDFRDPSALKAKAREILNQVWKKKELDPSEKKALALVLESQTTPPQNDELKILYEKVQAAKQNPAALTSEALDIEDAPSAYYRTILKFARSPAALQARQVDPRSGKESTTPKFNPSPEQAMQVLKQMVSDPDATKEDFEAMAWLIARANLSIDEKVLEMFHLPLGELRQEVEEMIRVDAWKYKGASSFAAIKLAKVLMDFKDEDYACEAVQIDGVGGISKENQISKILTWFGTYGNNRDADRLLFAKLARLILSKKKLCPRDRDLLIRAMSDWSAGNAPVQHEVACAVSENLTNTPFKDRSFEESLLIAQTVGLRSQLSWSGWVEQMKALGQIQAQKPGAMAEDEKEVYSGLVRFVLGNPQGKIQGGATTLNVPQSPENPKSIVKLCRNFIAKMSAVWENKEKSSPDDLDFVQGASLFLQKMRFDLDQTRQWPQGFEASGSSMTLRQEFDQKNMQEDLKALESNCADLPTLDSKSKKSLSVYEEDKVYLRPGQAFNEAHDGQQGLRPAKKARPSHPPKPRHSKRRDFDVNGR